MHGSVTDGVSIRRLIAGFVLVLTATAGSLMPAAQAQPLFTTYQGYLTEPDGSGGEMPFTGTAGFKFAIVDLSGASLWSNDGTSASGSEPDTPVSVDVANGIFTSYLGLGMDALPAMIFHDTNQGFLRVWVSTGGTFEQLDDMPLSSVPFALHTHSADRAYGDFTADGVIWSTAGGFRFPDGSVQTSAAGSTGPYWGLVGNSGTTAGTDFLGTTDAQPLVFKVDSEVALRLEPSTTTVNVIGGYEGNSVGPSVTGAVIGGGGTFSAENSVTDNWGTIGGGVGNQAGDGAGTTADADHATVGGGGGNTAGGAHSTVVGGWNNAAGGDESTIGGGADNSAAAQAATVGGGTSNWASASGAVVLGGTQNVAIATHAAVVGGSQNTASGGYATVGGGSHNTASGAYSFAAGYHARAAHDGSFVWADNSSAADFTSVAPNTFNIRAQGGVHIAAVDGVARISLLPVEGIIRTPGIEIFGGADIAEPFPTGDEPLPAGSVVVIDEHDPGSLRACDRPYDRRVAGVISGAGGIRPGMTLTQEGVFDDGQHVAITGRVYVLADASVGPVVPGDLLTTSSRAGHAMKAADPERRKGAVIGKAMSSLDGGQGLVLMLVTLQ